MEALDKWHIASAAVSLVVALALALVVLNPKISEGVVMKAGLIAVILGLLVTAALTLSASTDWPAYWRASFVTRAGLLVMVVGLLLRARRYTKDTIPSDEWHERTTRSWLRRISEPVNDLAHLFDADSSPAPLEKRKGMHR